MAMSFPLWNWLMEQQLFHQETRVGFQKVNMRTHVAHLLQSGPNFRFQMHMSFIFVVSNILQRSETSWNAKLAVKKSWFKEINQHLECMTEDDINNFTERLRQNPYARPESDRERAAHSLVKFANIVSDHVPGSMGEIQKMQEEMFFIVHSHCLPHLFLTLNPADATNPIAQVLTGRDIDLDKIFDDLSPGSEKYDRAKDYHTESSCSGTFFQQVSKNAH